ncbi:MAG: 23S rRNA (uracil(1939)-C(5))-methyltransferase RlmD [Clostridia bacterium]|nr:23S rRNA (uracil(1939)-C(5))-methyltransferase RlmD [Clostridia bacterium]
MLKKNDVIEIEIDGIGCNGEGIAHVGGYTVFIRTALPGEKVRAVIILAKPTFAVGKLKQVLRSSPDRTEPFCSVFGKCGGCGLQHVKYEAQLRYKREMVTDAFRKIAHINILPDEVVPSPLIKNYRNKMSLPVRGDEPSVGFFAEGTHRVVPISECPIQFEGNGKLIGAFIDFMRENGIKGYNETTGTGEVRHLAARKIENAVTVTAVANGNFAKRLAPFEQKLKELYGENYAYYVNINETRGNCILGENSVFIGGSESPFEVNGLKVKVHPKSFFQVNDGVRELLYAEIVKEANGENVVDAYSGAGVLGAMLARSANSVTAIEIEPKAVESARFMLAQNGIKNVETVCGDCSIELGKVLVNAKNSVVVLDPPRAGCSRAALDAVCAARPEKVLYVSCAPATLARDAAILSEQGYSLTRLTPFDMFPQTANLECLAVFKI